MGLDMTLRGRKVSNKRTEDGFNVLHVDLELAYWRKHADLHGHIVETFAGGDDECQEIELSTDDLDTLIAAIKEGDLPETNGFFFRYDGYDPKDFVEDDIKKLEAARNWVTAEVDGEFRYLVYQASW